MLKKFIKIITIFISLGIISYSAYANDNNVWMQISPVSNRVILKAGETLDYTFDISNLGKKSFKYKVYAKPYSVVDESYKLSFTEETTRTQVSNWITFKQADGSYAKTASFYIEPSAKQSISYRVSTPADVPSGGQYATIFAESEPEDDPNTTGVKAVSRIGLIVFGRTDGETKESVEVTDRNLPSFMTHGQITASYNVKNTGNTDFDATSTLKIEGLFGETLYEKTNNSSILPDTTRAIKETWEDTPGLGLYKATSTLSALGQSDVQQKLVLIIPIWLIIIAFMLLTGLILWIIILIRKRQGQKARVII